MTALILRYTSKYLPSLFVSVGNVLAYYFNVIKFHDICSVGLSVGLRLKGRAGML
jgi:hypothetical protein